jgi:hypothetical protein
MVQATGHQAKTEILERKKTDDGQSAHFWFCMDMEDEFKDIMDLINEMELQQFKKPLHQ